MWLRKDQGGCEITYKGAVYAWEKDGDVAEVPYELGVDLVNLGGYQVVPEPEQEQEPTAAGEQAGDDAEGDGDQGGDDEDEGQPGGDGADAGKPAEEPAKTPAEEPAKPARARSRKPAS